MIHCTPSLKVLQNFPQKIMFEDFVQDYDMNVEEFTQDAQGIESATWILKNAPPHPREAWEWREKPHFQHAINFQEILLPKYLQKKRNYWESSFFGGGGDFFGECYTTQLLCRNYKPF